MTVTRCLAAAALAALAACASAPRTGPDVAISQSAQTVDCAMSAEDSGWLASAIDAWHYTRERALRLPDAPMPLVILFDRRCAYHVRVADSVSIAGAPHHGAVQLPNDRAIEVRAFGMASPARTDSSFFLALALASVWRTDPQYRAVAGDWLQYLTGAFVHEMTHARMLPAMIPHLRQMAPALYPDSIRDDVVQDRFANEPLFAASVKRETDLLYRAAAARSRGARVDLARAALEMIRMRRARFYVGELESWFEIEQAFLDLEGIAQWAAFSHARARFHRRFSFGDALERFRGGEQFWSQDEGLALFLALDALDEGWQSRFFAEPRVSSLDLLARALDRR
jgi:hypothetical protein